MGMYTEIIFGARLVEPLPEEILGVLQALVKGQPCPGSPEAFPSWIMHGSDSYYFAGSVKPQLVRDEISGWTLHFRANLKNYRGEIEAFLSWIRPYIGQGAGDRDLVALVMYESAAVPTMYFLGEGRP